MQLRYDGDSIEAAVILAVGESRRMGRAKAWLEIDGKPLIQLAVEKVRALGIREIFSSIRVGEGYSTLNCPVRFDLEPGFGPIGGLEPLAAINPKRCQVLAASAITRAQYSASEFVSACLHERAARAFPMAHRDSGLFVNWNRPADTVERVPTRFKGSKREL